MTKHQLVRVTDDNILRLLKAARPYVEDRLHRPDGEIDGSVAQLLSSLDTAIGTSSPQPRDAHRSALVDVPAVEPVGETGEMPGSNGGFTMAVFKATDVPLGTKLFTSPPLSREGEDSAEVYRHKKRGSIYTVMAHGRLQVDGDLDNEKVVIYRGEDGQTWVRPEYEFNDGRFEALAATRSGSATTAKGCDHG